jgi:hypothetical protein
MYYMIIFVRHSVFDKKLVILFLFIQKIFKQISPINYIFKMIFCIHSELNINAKY